MERLAKKIAESIGSSLGKSQEDVAVIAYGLIGILQFMAIFLLASVVGLVFSFWLEVAVVFLSVGFLRRLTGGAHSSGIYSCLVYSVFFVCSLAALARYVLSTLSVPIDGVLALLVFGFGYFMIARKAPVTPPNKPCRTEAKRKRLRKGAFTVLTIFLLLVVLSFVFKPWCERLYSVGLALLLSTLWQITMMTKAGHSFISFFDGLFMTKKAK
jgi:accessory gene regulator B